MNEGPSPTNRSLAVSPPKDNLDRVVLAISAFRSDVQVISLLEKLFADGPSPFRAVIVVDSLASGTIEDAIRQRGWPVTYWNAPFNLGAAGNHAKRMELAADYDADWCFALNADGQLSLAAIRSLVECGTKGEQIGAVYPRRMRTNRGRSFESPRLGFLPLSGYRAPPSEGSSGAVPVAWASSNGALYHLEPARRGIFVWTDLWMGWEDLAYSWLLWKNGWQQILCEAAEIEDPYEYRSVRFLWKRIYIHDKPAWISYYTLRNLVFFVRRSEAGVKGWLVVLLRWLQESLLVVLYKSEKRRRLKLLWRGLLDGLKGRGGMVTSPADD